MLITFACPHCQKVLKSASPIAAGTAIRCPTCDGSFAMPATTSSTDDAVPAATIRPCSRRGLVVGLTLLLLGGLGAGGYFYFRDRFNPPRSEEPLAFVPPDAEIVLGIDCSALLDDALLGPEIEPSIRDLVGGDFLERCQKATGLARRELLGHALVAGELSPLGAAMQPALFGKQAGQLLLSPTVILQPTRLIDPDKMARAAHDCVQKTVHDKTYFEVKEGEWRTLYMPSDRIIVLSTRPANELDALFTSDGKSPALSGDVMTLVRTVNHNSLWAVVPFAGETQAEIQRLIRTEKGNAHADPLAVALANSKGMAVWGTMDSTKLTVGAHVLCADGGAAQFMQVGIEEAWKQQKGELDTIGLLLGVRLPKTQTVYQAITDHVQFNTDGAMVAATTSVSRKDVEEAHKELERNANVLGLFGNFPGLLPKKR